MYAQLLLIPLVRSFTASVRVFNRKLRSDNHRVRSGMRDLLDLQTNSGVAVAAAGHRFKTVTVRCSNRSARIAVSELTAGVVSSNRRFPRQYHSGMAAYARDERE